MQFSVDRLEQQIPYYLTSAAKDGLVKALAEFPRSIVYYLDRYKDEVLQGDGWAGFEIVSFEGERQRVKGIVLSNSCDIDPNNERAMSPRVVFAPLVSLARYADKLRAAGKREDSIESALAAIREQAVTSVFYLPRGGALEEDCIALLDDVHTVPLNRFSAEQTRAKLFTLGTVGFYLFLFKLSVHFCRFHENIDREPQTARPQ